MEVLHKQIEGHTLTFLSVSNHTTEKVYYGRTRVNSFRQSTGYSIDDEGLVENVGGSERYLVFYDWNKHRYVCIEDACPYEIVSSIRGEHL